MIKSTELTCEAKSVLYVSTARLPRVKWMGCGQCRWRQAGVLLLGIFLTLSALTLVMVGAIRSRDHSALKVVHVKQPVDVSNLGEANFTTAQLLKLTSIAQGKRVAQSSTSPPSSYRLASSQPPQLQHSSVDGSADTCSETEIENNPWWRVDLQYDVSIASVRIKGGTSSDFRGFEVEVTSEPNATKAAEAKQCRIPQHEGQGPTFVNLDVRIPCPLGVSGRYVTIKRDSSQEDSPIRLVLCEVMVFPR
ncbi:hypothetical protein RRG08_052857 [Elysia crispata]|uniref:Fucolectin tachylectin-4 pentraxin-1 domain-containing protein n=1 Tax=Elysia crispata TaxID=231223 RepID=A0AAE0XN83_9GAST|nr:hypothetical protein RRG08_052857 [Elysia crispata]